MDITMKVNRFGDYLEPFSDVNDSSLSTDATDSLHQTGDFVPSAANDIHNVDGSANGSEPTRWTSTEVSTGVSRFFLHK